ncbi:hypothetical protein ADUPG1_009836, partial [Aduncisulcus paluster]
MKINGSSLIHLIVNHRISKSSFREELKYTILYWTLLHASGKCLSFTRPSGIAQNDGVFQLEIIPAKYLPKLYTALHPKAPVFAIFKPDGILESPQPVHSLEELERLLTRFDRAQTSLVVPPLLPVSQVNAHAIASASSIVKEKTDEEWRQKMEEEREKADQERRLYSSIVASSVAHNTETTAAATSVRYSSPPKQPLEDHSMLHSHTISSKGDISVSKVSPSIPISQPRTPQIPHTAVPSYTPHLAASEDFAVYDEEVLSAHVEKSVGQFLRSLFSVYPVTAEQLQHVISTHDKLEDKIRRGYDEEKPSCCEDTELTTPSSVSSLSRRQSFCNPFHTPVPTRKLSMYVCISETGEEYERVTLPHAKA